MRALGTRLAMAMGVVLLGATMARADQLCDPAFQDCREPLLNLIRAETTGIDVAFWFMEDARYSAELVRRAAAGVPIRVLVDPRANAGHPINGDIIAELAAAGIPIRIKTGGPILHWKLMLFAGLGQVEFSGANYSPTAFVPDTPYVNYVDEAIYFSNDAAIVRSFMRKFDDSWIDPALFTNYANVPATRTRRYAQFTIAPELNFPPGENYRTRAVTAYNAEPSAIDVQMFRITDRAHTDSMIAAAQRGVRVRIISDTDEYRNPTRMWHSWNLDRLYMAGIPLRVRAHAGLNHEKAVILRGQAMTIFGSSNWTSPSADGQEEHNMFTTRPEIFQWFVGQFDRKWGNLTGIAETAPFVPLPPDAPVYSAPVNGAAGLGRDVTLQFNAGPFAHLYDIYLGTSPDPPRIAVDVPLGPFTGTILSYHVPFALRTGTTYYWRGGRQDDGAAGDDGADCAVYDGGIADACRPRHGRRRTRRPHGVAAGHRDVVLAHLVVRLRGAGTEAVGQPRRRRRAIPWRHRRRRHRRSDCLAREHGHLVLAHVFVRLQLRRAGAEAVGLGRSRRRSARGRHRRRSQVGSDRVAAVERDLVLADLVERLQLRRAGPESVGNRGRRAEAGRHGWRRPGGSDRLARQHRRLVLADLVERLQLRVAGGAPVGQPRRRRRAARRRSRWRRQERPRGVARSDRRVVLDYFVIRLQLRGAGSAPVGLAQSR
jgi:hypothetical protein